MTEITYPRRWSATIVVNGVTLPATDSEYDLQEDQRKSAIREAAMFLDEADRVDAVIYKTTKARGTEPDHRFTVYRGWDRRGREQARADGPYWAGMYR